LLKSCLEFKLKKAGKYWNKVKSRKEACYSELVLVFKVSKHALTKEMHKVQNLDAIFLKGY
jgi:hypothetical protein